MRVDEAAVALSLGRSKLYELLASGEISRVKIGRATRISAQALEEWVAKQAGGSDVDG